MTPISDEQLSAYLDGALSAAEKARVEEALAQSPELRKELARLRELNRWVKAVPAAEPPGDFYTRVLNKTRPQPRRWAPWGVSFVTAMAAALVMIFVFRDSKPDIHFSMARREMARAKTLQIPDMAQPALRGRQDISSDKANLQMDQIGLIGTTELKGEPPTSESEIKDREVQSVQKYYRERAANSVQSPREIDPVTAGESRLARKVPPAQENPRQESANSVQSPSDGSPVQAGESRLKETAQLSKKIIGPPTPAAIKPTSLADKQQKNLPAVPQEWRGDSSGVTNAREIIVRSAKEWEVLWIEHQSIQYPPATVPSVDFNTQMVVGVFVGDKGSSGYSVAITNVSSTDAETRVAYHLSTPDRQPGKAFLAVMTQPYHLKVIPRSDRPVRFVEQ